MGLSRKRQKDLKKLKNAASDLWNEQREVLDRANVVIHEAGRQLGNLSREEVAPRVSGVVDSRIRPVVSSSYNATRTVVGDARRKVAREVIPGVSASLATAIATLEGSKDPRVRAALKQVQDASGKLGSSASKAYGDVSKRATDAYTSVGTKYGFVTPPAKKSGLGVGGWLLIVVGFVAVAGVAYAAWQTLRADDELWVLDETDDIEPTK